MMPPECRKEAFGVGWAAAVCLLVLASYKIMVALAKGRQNVGFLIVLGITGAIAVLIAARLPRLTRQGKEYLDRLRLAFEDWPARIASSPEAVADAGRGHGDCPAWPAGSGRHNTASSLATADAQG